MNTNTVTFIISLCSIAVSLSSLYLSTWVLRQVRKERDEYRDRYIALVRDRALNAMQPFVEAAAAKEDQP